MLYTAMALCEWRRAGTLSKYKESAAAALGLLLQPLLLQVGRCHDDSPPPPVKRKSAEAVARKAERGAS